MDAVLGLSANRPKRLDVSDPVTSDGAVRIEQGEAECLYSGSGEMIWLQPFEISVLQIDSDAADASVQTGADERVEAICAALDADDTCGGNAMYGGLTTGEIEDLENDEGQMAGKRLALTVMYSHQILDPTRVGLR